MGRNPKPPLPELNVQGLSNAKMFSALSATYRCEFTGEIMPMDIEALAEHITHNPKVITNYRQRMRALKLLEVYHEAKRYRDQRDRAHRLIADKINPPPKLAHNQLLTESELVITIKQSPKPWRRM